MLLPLTHAYIYVPFFKICDLQCCRKSSLNSFLTQSQNANGAFGTRANMEISLTNVSCCDRPWMKLLVRAPTILIKNQWRGRITMSLYAFTSVDTGMYIMKLILTYNMIKELIMRRKCKGCFCKCYSMKFIILHRVRV